MDNVQLTSKQKKFLDYIITYRDENEIWPTYREIADRFGFKSPNSVTQNLQSLLKKGYLVKTDDNEYELHQRYLKKKTVQVDSQLEEPLYEVYLSGVSFPQVIFRKQWNRILATLHSNIFSRIYISCLHFGFQGKVCVMPTSMTVILYCWLMMISVTGILAL